MVAAHSDEPRAGSRRVDGGRHRGCPGDDVRPDRFADAVFAAVGTALVALVGVSVGGERLDRRTLLGLALVVVGVAVLRLEGV